MRVQRAHLGAAARIPELDGVIVAAGGDAAPVRGKRHGIDSRACPLSTRGALPVPSSQSTTAPSLPPAASVLLSGENAMESSSSLRRKVRSSRCALTSHSFAVPSLPTEASMRPSEENVTAVTVFECPSCGNTSGRGTRRYAGRLRATRQAASKHDQTAAPKVGAVAPSVNYLRFTYRRF